LKNYFDIPFDLWHFQMDKFGEASPTVMLALLEEAAAEHCLSIGYGLYDLLKQNIGWVLVAGALEMERYPQYKERIIIRTWLSEYSTIRGFRENLIYDEQGKVLGRAKGLWIFFDVQRRKPVPVYDAIINSWKYYNESSLTAKVPPKLVPLNSAGFTEEIKVRSSDVDIYRHANNIRYLQWLMDSIPEETIDGSNLHFIEGKFISEISHGDEVIMLTEREESESSFNHTIRIKNTDRVCAMAKTKWKKRVKSVFQRN
jgi:medium-chain acyl-[acyl-carrier-protein] hydrolase